VKDDAIQAELRAAMKRMDEAKTGSPLDAPFDAGFEEKAVARILREQAEAKGNAAAAVVVRPPARVWQRVGSIARSPMTWTAFAAAAAIALFVTRRSWHTTGAPLPPYAVAISGGEDDMRGEPVPRTSITGRGSGPVVIVLRPQEDLDGDVVVAVFGKRGDQVVPANAAARVAPSGAVEVKGRLRDFVGDTPGDAQILVAISRAGTPAPSPEQLRDGSISPATEVTRIEVRVVR
jgi:hypothetical protein